MAALVRGDRAGDEGPTGAVLHRRHVIGFDVAARGFDDAGHRRDLRFGFDERERREHHFLARIRERLRDHRPVLPLQHASLAAHDFAEVDDIDRRVAERGVEVERHATVPEVQDRPDGELHPLRAHCHGR